MRALAGAPSTTRALEGAAKSMIDLEGVSNVIIALEKALWLCESHRENPKCNNSLKGSP